MGIGHSIDKTLKLSQYIADGDGDFATGSTLPSDKSLFDILGATYTADGGGDNLDTVKAHLDLLSKYVADGDGDFATGAALPANKSLYDMTRAYGNGYLVSKAYADLDGYDTADAFTVTGDVMVRVIGVVGATGITSTSGTTTLSLGTTEAAAAIIAASNIDNTQFAATDVWVDSTPANDCEKLADGSWHIIGGGANIVLTRNVDDITAGTLTLYCWWTPLSSEGNVVAA